jgi:hypothetical protein
MTPKEKAKELTLKFMKIDSDSEQFVEFKIKFFYAQRCALIAVDEILSNDGWSSSIEEWNTFKNYFEQVKQEIQAL